MLGMDDWDIALLAVSGYIAVMALVRLMNSRRNQVIERIRSQMEQANHGRRAPEDRQATEPQQSDQAA